MFSGPDVHPSPAGSVELQLKREDTEVERRRAVSLLEEVQGEAQGSDGPCLFSASQVRLEELKGCVMEKSYVQRSQPGLRFWTQAMASGLPLMWSGGH